jgi:hypothetical protein
VGCCERYNEALNSISRGESNYQVWDCDVVKKHPAAFNCFMEPLKKFHCG